MNESFDIDAMVDRLRDAAVGEDAPRRVRAIIEEVVADPDILAAAVPHYGEDVVLFEDDTVSIWYAHFDPGKMVPAHDHQMSAVIGVFRGQERNNFYEADGDGGLRKSSDVVLGPGDVLSIGPSAIHSVACVSAVPCNGFHVYMGELTTVERSLFDVKAGKRLPFDEASYAALIGADDG